MSRLRKRPGDMTLSDLALGAWDRGLELTLEIIPRAHGEEA